MRVKFYAGWVSSADFFSQNASCANAKYESQSYVLYSKIFLVAAERLVALRLLVSFFKTKYFVLTRTGTCTVPQHCYSLRTSNIKHVDTRNTKDLATGKITVSPAR